MSKYALPPELEARVTLRSNVRCLEIEPGEIPGLINAGNWYTESSEAWIGTSKAKYLYRLERGAPESEIETLMVKFDDTISRIKLPDTMGRIREASVMGPTLSVGTYLAGSPLCFKRKVKREDTSNPIRVYISAWASASFRTSDLVERVSNVVALALALQTVRPVELYLTAESVNEGKRDALVLIKLGLSPLDTGLLATLFCTSGTVRGFLSEFLIKVARVATCHTLIGDAGRYRKYLGADENDIVSPSMVSSYGYGDPPMVFIQNLLREAKLVHATEET